MLLRSLGTVCVDNINFIVTISVKYLAHRGADDQLQ